MKHKMQTLRVNSDIHYKAKVAATQSKLTLQEWVEKLINKEVKKMID